MVTKEREKLWKYFAKGLGLFVGASAEDERAQKSGYAKKKATAENASQKSTVASMPEQPRTPRGNSLRTARCL